ncbi:hypothetical protein QBC39DRAFT_59966 [Podospora conica]|nr:hypothetical protein QBC39DRAFT_59966 [Schizothecium conicum]
MSVELNPTHHLNAAGEGHDINTVEKQLEINGCSIAECRPHSTGSSTPLPRSRPAGQAPGKPYKNHCRLRRIDCLPVETMGTPYLKKKRPTASSRRATQDVNNRAAAVTRCPVHGGIVDNAILGTASTPVSRTGVLGGDPASPPTRGPPHGRQATRPPPCRCAVGCASNVPSALAWHFGPPKKRVAVRRQTNWFPSLVMRCDAIMSEGLGWAGQVRTARISRSIRSCQSVAMRAWNLVVVGTGSLARFC